MSAANVEPAREEEEPLRAPLPRACQHWVHTGERSAPRGTSSSRVPARSLHGRKERPRATLPRACASPPSPLSRLAAEPLATCLRRHQGSVRLVTPTERRAAFSLKPPS